jgi:hypothetical protein
MLGRAVALSPRLVDQAIGALAQHGRNLVVIDLQSRSPGTPRIRYSPRRNVIAAAAGYSPNTDTGNLVNSIQVESSRFLQREIVARAEYAPDLEFGTRNMSPRPFMFPMAGELEQSAAAFFRDLLRGL